MTDITTKNTSPILEVSNLKVSFPSEAGVVEAVNGVSFTLEPGKSLGIVGESGSGKSVTSLAILGLLPDYARVEGSVKFAGKELINLSDAEMSKHRGSDLAMIFQDPLSALTPVYTVGDQIAESLLIHQNMTKKEAYDRAVELLDIVGIPNPSVRVKSFPHEFSGGMRQRVVIAQAIANNPRVLICDEPTTALDVTIQAQILDVIKRAQEETGAAVIMITHDMGVVANMADDVMVMYAGRPVEKAPIHELFHEPRMPYTIGLLSSIPRVNERKNKALTPIEGNPPILTNLPSACAFAPRCPIAQEACRAAVPELKPVECILDSATYHEAACVYSHEIEHACRNGEPLFVPPALPEDSLKEVPRDERETVIKVEGLTKTFPLMKGAILKRRVGSVYAVNGLDFEVKRGECFAIVGESGCGKTTTLLEIMNLAAESTEGTIVLGGTDVSTLKPRERRFARRDIQMVFQDPMGALDPRLTVREIIAEAFENTDEKIEDIDSRVRELMDLVGLDPSQIDRFPSHFSGGQRQRIGLARALATNPKLIVLDEPVSALDVSIQAGMINLLDELKLKLGISYILVAHDLSVIRHVSDRIAVMYLGSFVEMGETDEIFENPRHPYTQALLSAIPIPDPDEESHRKRIILEGDLPSPTKKEQACAFRNRCPLYKSLSEEERKACDTQQPALRMAENSEHCYACFYS